MRMQRVRTTQPLTTDAKAGLHHCAMCSATWLVAGRVSACVGVAAARVGD
jgi:hypothetical protein